MFKDISYVVPSLDEVLAAFMDWDSRGYSLLIGYLCFLLILALPLTQVDRRDHICAMVYVAVCSAAGVILILAVPQKLTQEPETSNRSFMVLIFAALAAARWYIHKKVSIKDTETNEATNAKYIN